MTRIWFTFGILLVAFNVRAKGTLQADVFLKVTSELPKWQADTSYTGVFSITNTGQVPFVVITDGEWCGETVRFYREGEEKQQRIENGFGYGEQRKKRERTEVKDMYHVCLEKGRESKILQPGDNITFECKNFYFTQQFSAPADVYKAEIYLGDDVWIPVIITPTLGTLFAVPFENGKTDVTFFYSKEGTNQYLYIKADELIKRVDEMELNSKPRQINDIIMYNSIKGIPKKLTRDAAKKIVIDREWDGGTDEKKKAVE